MRQSSEPVVRRVTEGTNTDRVRSLRIRLAGKTTAIASPGGGETQMTALASALQTMGRDARCWRPWEDEFGHFDLLHLFGSLPEHLPLIDAARRHGVRVALSPVSWFDWRCRWREPGPLWRRTVGAASLVARSIAPNIPSWRRRLYHAVDLLLPNSQVEAEQLIRLFNVPTSRIRVVPNGADERFAAGNAGDFVALGGQRGFVLYPGRIEPRKNQLGFLRAMRSTDVPIVVLGDVVPGHEEYFEACRREAGNRVRFVGRLPHDDPRLAGAYAACGCLALTSWFETPGLVALEAALTGTPLVLTRHGCAAEYFGELARYVDPADGAVVRQAILAALNSPRSGALAMHVREHFTWRAAAEATLNAYETIL